MRRKIDRQIIFHQYSIFRTNDCSNRDLSTGYVLFPPHKSLGEFLAGVERSLTSILTSSLLRDLPDQYLYRRNTRNRSSHLPKARPVPFLSEANSPFLFFFFFSSSPSSFLSSFVLCRRARLLASKGKIPRPR